MFFKSSYFFGARFKRQMDGFALAPDDVVEEHACIYILAIFPLPITLILQFDSSTLIDLTKQSKLTLRAANFRAQSSDLIEGVASQGYKWASLC
jgi:hypothetical protein